MARPRTFEPETALEAIKETFWRLGYEAASMQEIEAATGLNKQSLYRLYGDKRGMYLAALQSYDKAEIAAGAALLTGTGSARDRFNRLFSAMLAAADPKGCFLCNASIDQASRDDDTIAVIRRMMAGLERAFIDALSASPPYDVDRARAKEKAASLMASYFGLRIMIRAGAPRRTLKAATRDALDAI